MSMPDMIAGWAHDCAFSTKLITPGNTSMDDFWTDTVLRDFKGGLRSDTYSMSTTQACCGMSYI